MAKKVDLVVYENGERKVIGKAKATRAEDGHWEAEVDIQSPEWQAKLSDASPVSLLNPGEDLEEGPDGDTT